MSRKKGSKNGVHTKVLLTCERCLKNFEVEPYQAKGRKYCSWDCRSPNAGLSYSERAKIRRESLKKSNLCIDCGVSSTIDSVRCEKCAELSKERNRIYRKDHSGEKYKKHKERLETDPAYKEKYNKSRSEFAWKKRLKVIDLFGGKCECCGETTKEWLELDHVNQDGKKHRAEVGRGLRLLRDILKRPTAYKIRVLCANCHVAITRYGICPHQTIKNEIF